MNKVFEVENGYEKAELVNGSSDLFNKYVFLLFIKQIENTIHQKGQTSSVTKGKGKVRRHRAARVKPWQRSTKGEQLQDRRALKVRQSVPSGTEIHAVGKAAVGFTSDIDIWVKAGRRHKGQGVGLPSEIGAALYWRPEKWTASLPTGTVGVATPVSASLCAAMYSASSIERLSNPKEKANHFF
jgi:hypothetical protein